MAKKRDPREGRGKSAIRGGRLRECAYLVPEELAALERAAEEKRCSKSEIIRRALRSYLGVEL